jgi:hypothetical protein
MQVSVVLFRFENFIKLGKDHKVHAKLQQCNALIDYCYEACLCFSTNVLFIWFFRAHPFLISLWAHEKRGRFIPLGILGKVGSGN